MNTMTIHSSIFIQSQIVECHWERHDRFCPKDKLIFSWQRDRSWIAFIYQRYSQSLLRSARRDGISFPCPSFFESEGRETGFRLVTRGRSAEDRPDPPIINLPNRISSASRRLEKVGTRLSPRNSSSSRPSFFGLSFFSLFGFSDVDDSYNSSGHVSRVARRRVDSFLRIFHRDRNCERPDQKTRGERSEREKETGPGGCARGERMRGEKGEGSVGGSILFLCQRVAAR